MTVRGNDKYCWRYELRLKTFPVSTSPSTSDECFGAAFGQEVTPFDYQARLAGGNEGTACESKLINIPTGCGKTAAVVLAWLWNRVALGRADWPRRLVYCLPMRALVEQTRENVEAWLEKLNYTNKVGVDILMGGEEKTDWDIYPERESSLTE